MAPDTFLAHLGDILETDTPLTLETVLDGLKEWDALARDGVIAFAAETLGLTLEAEEVDGCLRAHDLFVLIGRSALG
jgi:hypothetical protein